MDKALKVIADRYSEAQILKAQDIIGDLRDELRDNGMKLAAEECDHIWELLADADNLNA